MEKVRILKSLISIGPYNSFIDQIVDKAQKRKSSYVCIANVHMTVEAFRSESFRQVMNEADITTPDGMPLAKSVKLLYKKYQDRVAGMDLFPDLLEVAEKKVLKVFLYGGSQDVIDKILIKAKIDFPDLQIVGAVSPPYRTLSKEEENLYIEQINNSGAHMVFVALGCPKQEKWMSQHKGIIHAVMLGVGGAFPIYAETIKRAPVWMQKASLEWFFRLSMEPRRLFKRYFITNSIFIICLIIQFFRKKAFEIKDRNAM